MDPQNVDLNLLAVLRILLEERHVTKAAKRLCLTQPAISKKLALLRDMFQDPLLVRVGNILEPTVLAISLSARLDNLFQQAQDLMVLSDFDPLRDSLDVNIAVTDFASQTVMPQVLSDMLKLSPNLRVHVRLWQRLRLMDLILGQVHCAKCHLNIKELPPEIRFIPLTPYDAICIMRSGHPLAEKKLTMEDYFSYRHISYVYDPDIPNLLDTLLAKQGMKRNISVCYPSVRGALKMVQNSDLLLSTSSEVATAYAKEFSLIVKTIPLEVPDISQYFIWHARSDRDPAHIWFRQIFLSSCCRLKGTLIPKPSEE